MNEKIHVNISGGDASCDDEESESQHRNSIFADRKIGLSYGGLKFGINDALGMTFLSLFGLCLRDGVSILVDRLL